MRLPQIRIRYAALLDPLYRQLFRLQPQNRRKHYPAERPIIAKVQAYKKNWGLHEATLLAGLSRATGLHFTEQSIDVFIVGKGYHPISHPLVIPSTLDPDYFVDVLTHELIHRILSDNTSRAKLRRFLNKIAPGGRYTVQIHVLVNAVHAYLLLEVLQDPRRLEREIRWAAGHPAHKAAWNIVHRRGYDTVVNAFRIARVMKTPKQ